jgi:para-nitrobenzyl esterase
VIAAYRKSRPGAADADIFLAFVSDGFVRPALHAQADRKVALGKAPVYVYYWTWRSPVRGGTLRSFHTIEIPFVMNNVDECKAMVGSGPEQHVLAQQVSGAWAAFARTGDPNHKGIPHWPAYDTTTRPTFEWAAHPKVVDDPDHAERLVLAKLAAGRGR